MVGCGSGALDRLVGREITVDGTTGRVWDGRIDSDTSDPTDDPHLRRLAEWAANLLPDDVGNRLAALPAGERLPAVFDALQS